MCNLWLSSGWRRALCALVASLTPLAAAQTPTIEQRWVRSQDGGNPAPWQEDWVADHDLGVAGFVYVFGAERKYGGGSYLVTRRYYLNDPTPPPPHGWDAYAIWPAVTDDDALRIPEAMTIVTGTTSDEENVSFVMVTGTTPGVNGDEDIIVVAYDLNLNLLWTARYTHPNLSFGGQDVPVEIHGHSNNTFAIVGTSESPTTGKDIVVLVYSLFDGSLLFEDRYSSPGNAPDVANDAVMYEGELFTVGTVTSGQNTKMAFMKHDMSPTPVRRWAWVYEGLEGANYVGVANSAYEPYLEDIRHYATGYRSTASGALENQDWITLRLPSGDSLPSPPSPVWTTSYSSAGAGLDRPSDIAAFRFKQPENTHLGVVVTGRTASNAESDPQFTTILYDDSIPGSSVGVSWVNKSDGGLTGGDDQGLRVSVFYELGNDIGGEVFVTGRVQNSAGNYDMLHMKFDTAPAQPPPNDNKLPRWVIQYPQATNAGADVPVVISYLRGVPDTNLAQPWPPGYTGPGYNMELPTVIISGSGMDTGEGENWKVIRYVERWE